MARADRAFVAMSAMRSARPLDDGIATLNGGMPSATAAEFTASEPPEWVHCHVARRPVPPAERVREIPATISALIETLLANTLEARYQTAAGVAYDLRRCLLEWEAGGGVAVFQLGERDTADQLLIPETLPARAGGRCATVGLRPRGRRRGAGARARDRVRRRREVTLAHPVMGRLQAIRATRVPAPHTRAQGQPSAGVAGCASGDACARLGSGGNALACVR
jgi:hypothetical protein